MGSIPTRCVQLGFIENYLTSVADQVGTHLSGSKEGLFAWLSSSDESRRGAELLVQSAIYANLEGGVYRARDALFH